MATGCLSNLPIHAAGYHDGSTRNALDQVISSYIPTIKALAYAKEKASKISETRTKEAMIVAMPMTADRNDLRLNEGVTRLHDNFNYQIHPTDAQQIGSCIQDGLFPDRSLRISRSVLPWRSVTKLSISQQLEDDIVNSFGYNCKWVSTILDLPAYQHVTLMSTETNNCSSLDEVIHIAGACQLVGFPCVVGTLWQIEDMHSTNFARDVYTRMLEMGSGIEVTKSATAVPHATWTLRDETRHVTVVCKIVSSKPLRWASYIFIFMYVHIYTFDGLASNER